MPARYRVTRILEWDAAHRVMRHESKCASLHGHRYKAEIVVSAPELDPVGRVVDFGFIKEIVGSWIDEQWDHTTLVNLADASLLEFLALEVSVGKKPGYGFTGEPTAENIARELYAVAQQLMARAPAEKVSPEVKVEMVRVWETPNCQAEYPA